MSTTPHIVRRRVYKRQVKIRTHLGSAGLGCSLLISLFLLISGIAIILFYINLTRDLPSLEIFPLYLDAPDGVLHNPTVFFDRTGENVILTLRDPAAAEAQFLRVPQEGEKGDEFFSGGLIKAVIANMDPTFWTSEMPTFRRLLDGRENLLAQRLVSEFVLWGEPQGTRRNLRVRLLASQIITQYGREKVLEWYLNSAKFGHLVYGADSAAHVYLGKSASELDIAEGALLAAIVDAPDINPHTIPELTLERQKKLIQMMVDLEVITVDEAVKASEQPLIFEQQIEVQDDFKSFTNFVIKQLTSIIPRERLEQGGLKIITSMDYDLQTQTQCAVKVHFVRSGVLPGELGVINDTDCEAARLLPTVITSGSELPDNLDAVVAVANPELGQILALVRTSSEDDTIIGDTGFPAGTLLTPYIYLTAFTRGFNPGTMVWDIPEDTHLNEYASHESDFDEIVNSIEPYHGPIRLRTALANDYIRPAKRLLEQIGSENVLRTLTRFGLRTEISSGKSLNLNQLVFEENVTMVDAVRAFSVLANSGMLTGHKSERFTQGDEQVDLELGGVIRVEDISGNVLLDWSTPQSRSIVSPQLTYLVSNILSDESARWVSLGHPNPLEIGRPAAVKFSRTIDGSGAWVLGYVPSKVVGVWVESQQSTVISSNPQLSTGLWHAIIQYTLQEEPVLNWEVPPGIDNIEVCDPSGLLPSIHCPLVVPEVFLSDQGPTHTDTLYRLFQINRETGNLATVFTPPELIDERVYMMVPPQAEEWARSQNYPIPPDSYDAIALSADPFSEAQIDSPEMFSHVNGTVLIKGSAGGPGFSYYRVQVGQGLNPDGWIQLGEDFRDPVNDGVLTEWDTNGLKGLYAVQLLVVHQDQRVDTFVLQVTVDNQPPEVEVLSPIDEQSFSLRENEILILRADANDDVELENVEFYLDDRLFASVNQPPYIISWEPRIGEHTLLVIAKDLAGNVKQDYIEFTVER